MGPICAYYERGTLFRNVTAVWSGKVFHLWVLTFQNLFYTWFPHPATSPSWTAKPEPCEFAQSAVDIDGTLYDAMGKGLHKNITSLLIARSLEISVF